MSINLAVGAVSVGAIGPFSAPVLKDSHTLEENREIRPRMQGTALAQDRANGECTILIGGCS